MFHRIYKHLEPLSAFLKLAVFALICVMLAGSFLASAPAEPNTRISNLNGWSTWSHHSGRNAYIFSMEKNANWQAAKLESIEESAARDNFASVYQTFKPNKFKDQKIHFTAFIIALNVNGQAGIFMSVENSKDEVISFDDMSNRAISGTADWKKCTIILPVPNESKRLRMGFMLKGTGSVWLRDISIALAERDAKSTAIKFIQNKFQLNLPGKGPRNLAFDDTAVQHINHPYALHHWATSIDPGYSFKLDRETVLNGKPSVLITCTDPTKNGFGSIYQVFDPSPFKRKRMRFSAYIKTEDTTDWSGLFMEVDAADRVLGFDAMEDRPLKGTNDWKKIAIVLDVPEETKKIKIGFLHTGSGRSWISNGTFEAVGTDVPTTGKPVKDDRFPEEPLDDYPKTSFE
jgi:hypothetical protein